MCSRKQCVAVDGHTSQNLPISCGVPQGSILGPLLFLLYINDLPSCTRRLKFCLFADDTSILFKSKDLSSSESMINSDLCIISRWFQANKLSLNVDKTNFVIFHPVNSQKPQLNLFLNGVKIRESSTVKFLGVLLDQHLNWKSHIDNVCSKVARIVGIFHKIKFSVPQNILKSLYYTLVYPHLPFLG